MARFFRCLAILLLSTRLLAQECTADWSDYLDTDPTHAKVISGDANAGYAIFAFWGDPDLELELRGDFPHARFLSIETEKTRLPVNFDHLFDTDIDPDAGSQNPFREGVAIATPNRAFTVVASPVKPEGAHNTVKLPGGDEINAIMLRIYRPNAGVTLTRADLPRVFARNRRTGEPMACPRRAWRPVYWPIPQVLADGFADIHPFEFEPAPSVGILGLNQAAQYVYAVTKLAPDEVVLLRFRAPSIVDTSAETGTFGSLSADVRYWSLCTNNFFNDEGLACVADTMTSPLEDGLTYTVVGRGGAVAEAASQRGYSFIPDIRGDEQHVMGFAYRNLVPTSEFQKNRMYQGDYLPEGKLCAAEDFVAGDCRW